MITRRMARFAWACLLQSCGAIDRAKRRIFQKHGIVVLTMHRVLHEHEFGITNSLPGTLLRHSTFVHLIEYVRQQFSIVSIKDSNPDDSARRLRLALTFDDGWLDTFSSALPVIRDAAVPATVFVCPGLLEQSSPFWPENLVALLQKSGVEATEIEARVEEIKALPAEDRKRYLSSLGILTDQAANDIDRTMSWSQMQQMADAGITIGSHTQTHEILTTVSAPAAREQLEESRNGIQQGLSRCCPLVSYPNGNHSSETRTAAAGSGFERGFTTAGIPWEPGCDPLAIPRVNVAEDDVTGPTGLFSPLLFDYTVFWKPLRRSLARG